MLRQGERENMNLNYIIGLVGAALVCIFGMVTSVKLGATPPITINFANLINFFDPASILIVIGCTIFIVVASFPGKMLKAMPKHFKIILNNKLYDPGKYIDQLVDLAQIARKNGLLALEEKANSQEDPFFKQAIMLIVDAYDQDKVRSILENDIECMSARHEDAAAMYDKASSVAPAFGMVGTLVGLINMLKGMSLDGDGASNIGSDMVFGPIATLLRNRDEEEVLCKMIIVEGIMSIQAGENPKFLRDRLLTYMAQKQREGSGKGKGADKGGEEE